MTTRRASVNKKDSMFSKKELEQQKQWRTNSSLGEKFKEAGLFSSKFPLRERVMIYAGMHMPIKEIAQNVGLPEAKLLKDFASELSLGQAKTRGKTYERLFEMLDGKDNSAALKAFLIIRDHQDSYVAPRPVVLPDQSKDIELQSEEAKLGKKEAANRESIDAHKNSSWGELIN